jgi:hypothetical protein
MGDQLQELGDFGLKGKSLFFHGERVGDDGLVFQGPDGLQAPQKGMQAAILFGCRPRLGDLSH